MSDFGQFTFQLMDKLDLRTFSDLKDFIAEHPEEYSFWLNAIVEATRRLYAGFTSKKKSFE